MSVKKETKPFQYCDSPDGEDILPKLGLLVKPLALTAFGVSTIDVMLYSHPKGYMQTLSRYIHYTWPIFGTAAAFVLGQNLAGSIRKKDDKLNWFIGGASAGSVVGLWRRSIVGGVVAGLAFGVLAIAKKDAVQNNSFLLIPDKENTLYGGIRSCRQDFTLMKERPRNWITGKE